MHWSAEDIAKISITTIQKKLPFAISYSDIANFVGNLSLNPYAIPTTERTKYLTQSTFAELMRKFHPDIVTDTHTIPDDIKRISSCESETILTVLNSYCFSGITNIRYNKEKELTATVIKISPEDEQLTGNVVFDFGTNEIYTQHLAPQQISHVPTAKLSKILMKLNLKAGKSKVEQNIWNEISASRYGIIIDTRDDDVISQCSTPQAKKLSENWMKSLDIEVGNI